MGVYFSSTFNFLSLVLDTWKEHKDTERQIPVHIPWIISSTFDLFFLVLDTWKQYKEYREANPGPRTLTSFHTSVRFGGKDRPGFVWKEKMDVKQRKAGNYISKIQKNKDDKNCNENNLTVWDRLGWTKKKSPVRHNLDGFKQYNFTNSNVALRE